MSDLRRFGDGLYGVPPGADFPHALAAGLGQLLRDAAPEAMARVTLYLNTARMRERVRAAFCDLGAGLLPKMLLVTDIGAQPIPGIAAPVPALRRKLELTVLVSKLLERAQDFAPGTAAFDLAESLAALIEEMHDEGVTPGALFTPSLAEDHAAHWERSLSFLRIIAPWFALDAAPTAADRQRKAVDALIASWEVAPPADPVIVAGSTGSRGSTALLMRAVAGLPNGALVLPGFDFDLPDFGWNSLDSGAVPNEDHPQYRFARLLRSMGRTHADVRHWPAAKGADLARNRLISLALRPAPVTDQWLTEGGDLLPLSDATRGLSLIEAGSPREEAMAIAVALRAAAESGTRATLITPDRTLVRRVTAALDQWGIRPDDSAGQPLHLSAPGRFLRHIAAQFGRKLSAEALLILLKHPLTATGSTMRGEHLNFTRQLELTLRKKGPIFPTSDTLRLWGAVLGDPDAVVWADWVGAWVERLPTYETIPLSDATDTLLRLAEDLAAGPSTAPQLGVIWQFPAGEAAFRVIQELRREAGYGGTVSPGVFNDLLSSLLEQEPVRERLSAHPLISIQGTREARQLQAQLVILGGLNEATWPQGTQPDPWLSRQMRLQVGLLLPERQIGLAAHDFQLAASAPEVILTRAIRDDEAQTVPSRWLDRLKNLILGLEGEAGALNTMRQRGQVWLDQVRNLEQITAVPAALRPSPRPPVGVRPRELPVTAIKDLVRDPYAIYAKYVLRLRPLDPLLAEADPRMRGQVLHKIVERFVGERPDQEDSATARDRLLATTAEVLESEIPFPSARRLWLARITKIAGRFVQEEADRLLAGSPVLLEGSGGIELSNLGFRLTARPDRIDRADDGSLLIYDYKSGDEPKTGDVRDFDKQLLLEAAMAERGAFVSLGAAPVKLVSYIKLGPTAKPLTFLQDEGQFDQVWQGLQNLIQKYCDANMGYSSRRMGAESRDRGDFDQLARFGEWQLSDPPAPEDVT